MSSDNEFDIKVILLLGIASVPLGVAVYGKSEELVNGFTTDIWAIAIFLMLATVLVAFLRMMVFRYLVEKFGNKRD